MGRVGIDYVIRFIHKICNNSGEYSRIAMVHGNDCWHVSDIQTMAGEMVEKPNSNIWDIYYI